MKSGLPKNAIIAGGVAVVLAVGAYLFLRSSDPSSKIADDPTARLAVKCTACGAEFSLSAAEQDRAFRGGGATAMRSSERVAFRCRECGKMTAQPASESTEKAVPE